MKQERGVAHGVSAGGDGYDTRPPFEARLAGRAGAEAKGIAKRLLYWTIAAIGLLTRSPRSAAPELRAGNPLIHRILVIRVDLIGDVVLSLPAVRLLRRAYPHAEIDMLVLRSSAGILEGQPEVSRVLAFDPYLWRHRAGLLNPRTWRDAWAFLRLLRARRYDLVVSIAGDIASVLARLTGAPRRVGYAREAYPFMLTDALPGGRYHTRRHELRYVLDLAAAAGATVLPEDARVALRVTPQAAATVEQWLRAARQQLGRTGPIVTLHPGARNGQAKRWPPGHLAALADRLATELDALVVLSGGPGEEPIAQAVIAEAGYTVYNLCGKTSLPELAALLHASDVVVSGDSGPMHIACAVGTPVVALHGPTDPALSGPTAPDALVLRLPLWCSPCYDPSATAECRFGNPICMKALSPATVFDATLRQLARAGVRIAPRVSPQPTAEQA